MNGTLTMILPLIVLLAVMYFLLIRPQKKREKEVNAMRKGLQVGDEIITIGGICGKIVKTKDESLVIQVGADKVKFEIMRWAVSRVVEESKRPAKNRAAEEVEEVEEKKPSKPKRIKKAAPAEEVEEKEEVVEAAADHVVVKRQFEDGYHIIKIKTPCLLTAIAELATPRYMSVRGIVEAYEKEIKVLGFEDLKDGLELDMIGLKGSPTNVYQSFTKEVKGAGTILEGLSADEAVKAIMDKLEAKFII